MVVTRILIIFTLLILTACVRHLYCDSEEDGTTTEAFVSVSIYSDLLKPRTESNLADSFLSRNGETEYLLVNNQLSWLMAVLLCKESYNAKLVKIMDLETAYFLSEALSETTFGHDALWIGARQTDQNWTWVDDSTEFVYGIDDTGRWTRLFEAETYNRTSDDKNGLCMGFQRQYHDVPKFVPLKCTLYRSAICVRPYGSGTEQRSTHRGWIEINKNYYKIFHNRVSFENGTKSCMNYDNDAKLALVNNTYTYHVLAKYMLIGRPSIESAWIGARYYKNQYTFVEDNVVLAKNRNGSFPPWRYGRWKKNGGCVLLDRHIEQSAVFSEANCERRRPYICYKIMDPDVINKKDFVNIQGEYGYRIFYVAKDWEAAYATCKNIASPKAPFRTGWLASPKNITIAKDLVYIMGNGRTPVNHAWLGGRYNLARNNWTLPHDPNVSIWNEKLNFYTNTSFRRYLELANICLNIDRDNYEYYLLYGTVCSFYQNFICQFEKVDLIDIIEEEKKEPSLMLPESRIYSGEENFDEEFYESEENLLP